MHIPNGCDIIIKDPQIFNNKLVGKKTLIDDFNYSVISGIRPYGPEVRVVYLHVVV
jgi:hypothetical protein